MNRPLDLRLHHWGFVVADIERSAESFSQSLGAAWDKMVYHDPNQRVRVTFLSHTGSPVFELVQPASEDSPVSRFLRERGGGLHHVCYEVEELEASMAELRSRGSVIAKRPLPAVAFGGRRIAWVITREKLLVELLERTAKDG